MEYKFNNWDEEDDLIMDEIQYAQESYDQFVSRLLGSFCFDILAMSNGRSISGMNEEVKLLNRCLELEVKE